MLMYIHVCMFVCVRTYQLKRGRTAAPTGSDQRECHGESVMKIVSGGCVIEVVSGGCVMEVVSWRLCHGGCVMWRLCHVKVVSCDVM